MNKNDECEIVKDLSIQYIENLLNIKSKKFIDEHLINCDNCKKYYHNLKSNILNEQNHQEKNDELEINFLKKFRKRFNILKVILITILIIILLTICTLFIKYYYVTSIIEQTYQQLKSLKTLDNYLLLKDEIYINENEEVTKGETNLYYKNGKYKIYYYSSIENSSSTRYTEDDSYIDIYVYDNLKTIDYINRNYMIESKGSGFSDFSDIISYRNEYPKLFLLNLSIYTDNFNGKECYVIKDGDKFNNKTIWIEKDTYNIIRIVYDTDSSYEEYRYTLIENEVLDKDVDSSVLETEEYNDYTKTYSENNATEEIKSAYEKLREKNNL